MDYSFSIVQWAYGISVFMVTRGFDVDQYSIIQNYMYDRLWSC